MLGLPNKVTAAPVKITSNSTEMVFHVKTDASTPPGEVKNLFCRVTITQNGEPIVHNLGTGRLRVNQPTPVSGSRPASAKATLTSAKSGSARPLSRLEKLRLESKKRAQTPAPRR